MELPIIGETWIIDRLNSEFEGERAIFLYEFKFILVQGPENQRYVRFGKEGQGHNEIADDFFYGELSDAVLGNGHGQQYIVGYERRGGGWVRMPDFEESDIDSPKDHYSLHFYGSSDRLGSFDKGLLERTLLSTSSNRFSYRVD
ncbi:MAG: hypothetical protein AABX82_09660 [Nanoarchaeota archaeon]